MLIDISRPIHTRTATWPGDTKFSVDYLMKMSDGDSVNLSTITMSPHTGTHADAFYHNLEDGIHPLDMPLENYIGPATLVSTSRKSGPLVPSDFDSYHLESVERLLIHSHISDNDETVWTEDFPHLSLELVDWLVTLGCKLIGLDSPSVDHFHSKTLDCHKALAAHGIVNLECLSLKGVPDGEYELIAAPLRFDQVCATPIRAILRTLN